MQISVPSLCGTAMEAQWLWNRAAEVEVADSILSHGGRIAISIVSVHCTFGAIQTKFRCSIFSLNHPRVHV